MARRIALLHPWVLSDLKIVSAATCVLTVLGLPAAIRRIQATLREASRSIDSESRLIAASESSIDAIFLFESVRSEDGTIVDFRFNFLNQKGAAWFGRQREEMLGENLYELVPELYSEERMKIYRRVIETGEPETVEYSHPLFQYKGQPAYLSLQVVKLHDGMAVTATDISARHIAENELQSALSFNRSVIACSPFCMIVSDKNGVITSANPAAERLLLYSESELVGQNVTLMHDPAELSVRAMELSAEFGSEVYANHQVFHFVPERGITDEREWTFIRKDGSDLPVQLMVSALKDHAGETIGFLSISYDLTERKRADEYIYHAANHDPLTGLPTRTLLRDRLDVAIERAKRSQDSLAVMIVDLDDFKRVNDSLGHQAGDTMLCEVAQRLRGCVRKSDTVARMGGDEFVVLLTDMNSPSDAEEIGAKLLEAISRPLRIGRHDVTVTASIGISMFPDGGDIDTLFKNADLAMYRVKARGRNGAKLFTPGLGIESLQKVQMESALRGAIEGKEFEIVYQPQISFEDNRMIGVEALLRWHSPEFGTVMPTTFIPLAEETGLIIPIGEWILKTACKEVAALQSELQREIMLAVNISPRQFQQKNFPITIEQAIRESGLRPEQLELEITEQLLMMDSEESLEIMRRVRTLGVRFAIDDFGTGFSNMGYITRFAVDRIKIDRSFICKCDTDSNSRAVTSAIIALAHSLEIEVIAEGVETTKHVEMLTAMQCDQAQGYLYSRPLKLPALKRFSAKAIVLPRISPDKSGVRRAFTEISQDELHLA